MKLFCLDELILCGRHGAMFSLKQINRVISKSYWDISSSREMKLLSKSNIEEVKFVDIENSDK